MMTSEWTQMREPSRCLSDLALDQLAAGEDQGALVAEARQAHLRQCPGCEARRAALMAARETVLARRPALDVAGTGVRTRWQWWPGWVAGALALSAFAVFAAFAVTRTSISPAVRTKGGLGLEVFVKRAGGRVEALLPNEAVTAGDALRFRISADGEGGVVTIVGVDAAGGVDSYDPAPEETPVLAAGERRLLEGSIILDGTTGRERLLALLCPDRRQAARALAEIKGAPSQAREGAPLRSAAGCRLATFPLRKVARP